VLTYVPFYNIYFIVGVGDKRKIGRGTIKGLSVEAKRFRLGTEKLSIDFSSTKGGPIGDNYRSFVDEIVRFTRKMTPLIGVKKWKHVKQIVKDKIAEDIIVRYSLAPAYDKLIFVISYLFIFWLVFLFYRLGGILRTMIRRRLGYGRLQSIVTKDGELN
jgi:hypothetical protein